MMQETSTPPITIEALKHEAFQLRSISGRALKRVRKKIEKQEADKAEASDFLKYSQHADSLIAHPDVVRRGDTSVIIENIHTQIKEPIELDPALSVFENAKELYRRARKGKRGLEIIEDNLEGSKKEEQSLQDILGRAEKLVSVEFGSVETFQESLVAVRNSLVDAGVVPRQRKTREKTDEEAVPYRHLTLDGWNIYIGKNDAQNDELSTRFAKPWDIWMHVVAHAGSHVVIRRDKNADWPPREILLKVAAFAVWFSKAKHTSYAEVHVTEARFVRKRRHAPPGEVIAERCKTLRVSPKSPQEFFSSVSG
jgi:predicted ribosome quality control (RQC) complex YloA/Tae2 family protein